MMYLINHKDNQAFTYGQRNWHKLKLSIKSDQENSWHGFDFSFFKKHTASKGDIIKSDVDIK